MGLEGGGDGEGEEGEEGEGGGGESLPYVGRCPKGLNIIEITCKLISFMIDITGHFIHDHVTTWLKNKAGYTANTSCGRVGRGGNACFHTFRLVFTDRPTDRLTDGRTKPLIELRVRN